MNRSTSTKLAFVGAGLTTFLAGVNLDSMAVRWVGIALVAVAWLLRFRRPT